MWVCHAGNMPGKEGYVGFSLKNLITTNIRTVVLSSNGQNLMKMGNRHGRSINTQTHPKLLNLAPPDKISMLEGNHRADYICT